MKILNVLALILVIVGALNWGLVAIAEFDLVAEIFGEEFGTTNALTRIIYASSDSPASTLRRRCCPPFFARTTGWHTVGTTGFEPEASSFELEPLARA